MVVYWVLVQHGFGMKVDVVQELLLEMELKLLLTQLLKLLILQELKELAIQPTALVLP